VTGAKTALEQKERNRRQAKEAIESNENEADTQSLSIALRIAQIDSRAATAELRLRSIELQNQKLEGELRDLQLTFLQEKIEHIEKGVRFVQQGLDEYLAQIDEAEFRLTQALELAQADFAVRDAEWIEARRRLEASPTKGQDLVEELEARQLARRARQREVSLINERVQALSDTRKVWNRRFHVFNDTADNETVDQWEAETRQALDQINRDLRINSARLTELRKEAITLDSEINASNDASLEVRRWLEQQKHHLNAMVSSYTETVDRLESARRLHDKLLSEISTQASDITLTERLDAIWVTILHVWNYELTSIQDNPITVRKIVIGIILLLVGLYASRLMSGWLGRRFLPRFGLNEGAIAAIQSLLFYLLLITVIMLSLRIVNVPLTAFTILGGALAIGIGFGSQNIVNNFISGLILLAERPIRVGDLVEIDDLIGVIEHIGPRSTRVRSPENMDIIVPNSSFLENNVVNWTLTDDRYRTRVVVGVVYGSPTRDVIKLIRKAVDDHGKVLPQPEPIILFADFGDNALIFEAHFWVRMRRIMERRIIESDIRARIDSLFREAGIVIAFPQRDVHLDSQSPIQVEVLQQGMTSGAAESMTPHMPDAPTNDGSQA
jgi:small-conductance mechanosensitive channel